MAEDEGKQEEKFEFTTEGEALGYISLDQAQVLAMRTAREAPGVYGTTYRDSPWPSRSWRTQIPKTTM